VYNKGDEGKSYMYVLLREPVVGVNRLGYIYVHPRAANPN